MNQPLKNYYEIYSRMFVAVDCIIFGIKNHRLSILLTRRKFEPEKGAWSLMGGFVEPNESIDQAAYRVLSDLTGLKDIYMEQVGGFGSVDRDPGERVVSIAYTSLINLTEDVLAETEAHGGCWTPFDELPPLCFDHPQMIEAARQRLQRNFATEPVAFNLLPEYFTLSQLQALYETVLDEEIDKRNFRKRVNELSCIVPTEKIDKTTSRRGARLHRFDFEAYSTCHKFKL